MKFVLKEVVATKQQGKPIYFQKMAAIGPCNTDDFAKAAKFDSKVAAYGSSANRHMFSFYEPEEVS